MVIKILYQYPEIQNCSVMFKTIGNWNNCLNAPEIEDVRRNEDVSCIIDDYAKSVFN